MKRGTASPTPHAPTPRRQCPRCCGAWQWRLLCVATATPQSRHGGTQGRRLLRITLRHPSVGSRFPLKQPPGFPCGSMASVQGFLSRWSLEPMAMARGKLTVALSPVWLRPLSVLLQTGLDLRREARGPCAGAEEEPANDRPSPSSVLIQASTCPSAAPGRQASFSTSRVAIGLASVGSWQRHGHSHSKPKNLFPCYVSVGQFLCWEEPCKLPR